MVQMEATVRNKYGIHCRPSALIVKAAQTYAGTIHVARADTDGAAKVDAKSVLGLMGLGLAQGAKVHLLVAGPDEDKVCREMIVLFEKPTY